MSWLRDEERREKPGPGEDGAAPPSGIRDSDITVIMKDFPTE